MNTPNIIEVRGLRKSFQDVHAVKGIDFDVREGELFAFLGLNGAGKSTTISILCGQLTKDAGQITVCGKNLDQALDEIKAQIGVVFQNSVLDKVLTARENLRGRAALYGIVGKRFDRRLAEMTELLDLGELLNRPVGKLSGGQRRRVDVARALFHDPRILILDEPTTGLDPQSRVMVWGVVEKLRRKEGLTVFLTTHYMEEAAEADYVVILESGSVVANGTPHDLKTALTGDFIKLYGVDGEALRARGIAYEAENGYLRVRVANTVEAREMLIANADLFDDFEVIRGGMDDVFLAATGKTAKEAN